MKKKTIVAISCVVLSGGMALIVVPRQLQIHRAASQEAPNPIKQQLVPPASPVGPAKALARVFETHERVINYLVSVPIYETHTKEVNYTVMTPVTETLVKEVPYSVLRTITEEHTIAGSGGSDDRIVKSIKYVPESKVKSVRYSVCKMVPGQRTKTVTYKTCRIVTETRQKTVQYTTCRYVPAGTLQDEVDQVNERAIDPMGSNRCLN